MGRPSGPTASGAVIPTIPGPGVTSHCPPTHAIDQPRSARTCSPNGDPPGGDDQQAAGIRNTRCRPAHPQIALEVHAAVGTGRGPAEVDDALVAAVPWIDGVAHPHAQELVVIRPFDRLGD